MEKRIIIGIVVLLGLAIIAVATRWNSNTIDLKVGDSFYYEYGFSIRKFKVVDENKKGYFCSLTGKDLTPAVFILKSDLATTETYKKIETSATSIVRVDSVINLGIDTVFYRIGNKLIIQK